jgi:pentatricopeptide repeat protein
MMMNANALPDQYTATTLLKPIKTVKEPKKYWTMLSPFILQVLKQNELPNLELITALISAYTRLGEFEEITKLFQLVKEHPLNYKLDKQFFDCMFRVCSYSGNVALGIQLFDEMLKAKIAMDRGTYVLLRNLFLHNKKSLKGKELKEAVDCAKRIYKIAEKTWIEPQNTLDYKFAAFCKIKAIRG